MPKTIERVPASWASLTIDILLMLMLATVLGAVCVSQCFIRF